LFIVNNKSFKEEILGLPTSSTCPLSSFIYRLWNASSVFFLFCLLSQDEEEEEEEEEEDGWKSSRNPAQAQETHRTELRSDFKRLNVEQCFSSSWALRGQIIHPCASPLLLALKISSLSLSLSHKPANLVCCCSVVEVFRGVGFFLSFFLSFFSRGK
jgi:hypothetical protein